MITRRSLLKLLLASPLAAVVKLPPPSLVVRAVTLDELNAVTVRAIMPGIVDNFYKSTPLLEYLKSHARHPVSSYRPLV